MEFEIFALPATELSLSNLRDHSLQLFNRMVRSRGFLYLWGLSLLSRPFRGRVKASGPRASCQSSSVSLSKASVPLVSSNLIPHVLHCRKWLP